VNTSSPDILDILKAILSQPTAPFREQAVVRAVRRWADGRGVDMTQDAAGNVLLRCGQAGCETPRWFFTAHLDHPGFIVVRSHRREVVAEFRGTVGKEYFGGARVRFFPPAGAVTGTVGRAVRHEESPWLRWRVRLDSGADLPAGTIGMWDLPAFAIRGGRIISRACDDVVGSAAVVCALDRIARLRPKVNATGLLTRAEEAGFVGALAACAAGSVPSDALIVSIEASKAHPQAKLGDGVIIRVGDRMRTFAPTLTAHLAAVAGDLAKRDRRFLHVRQLMPGGTCESTVFQTWGYQAAAVCLPLANYHNMAPDGRIAAEQVNLNDFLSLVKLLVALAADARRPEETDAALRKRLTGLLSDRGKYLREGQGGEVRGEGESRGRPSTQTPRTSARGRRPKSVTPAFRKWFSGL
jgi:putative aminopeptidase FrvX